VIEVKIVGRGGQGVVLASQILAAAFFEKGHWVQAFPSFGAERRGAPVGAFVRVSDRRIFQRCAIRRPDWIIVLDPGLLAGPATLAGVTAESSLVANRAEGEGGLEGPWGRRFRIDATAIAREAGLATTSFPLVNAAMAGAFAGACGLLEREEVAAAVGRLMGSKAEANQAAAREAFARVREVAP
jgi:2-oxoacid:acceptor oxidoreductase gamma subunit (pyruvate/2-ketoisovalerate family)